MENPSAVQKEDFTDASKSTKQKKSNADTQTKKIKPMEKYYRVMFMEKASPNDTDDVELSVNAETLVIQRNAEVIIPERFKVCADNATYQQFKQVPGKPRKLRGTIKVYPYQLLGEATREEFLKMKRDGDRKTKEHIAKFGFGGAPED